MIRVLLLVVCASLFSACGETPPAATNKASPAPANSPAAGPTVPTAPLTGFEKDLQYIRNGNFTYIWVFSRKDGKPLDRDDAAFLRTNAPQVIDWVTTDEGRKVIAGTNFNLEEGNFGVIQKRFVTENYSGK
jgi:hypothetical protein